MRERDIPQPVEVSDGHGPPLYGRPSDDELHRLYTPQSTFAPPPAEPAWRTLVRRLTGPLVALGLLIWKAKFLFVALFKFKLFTVAGSMIVSIASRQAESAASRCGADTAITTLVSPIPTLPIRWWIATAQSS